MKEKQNIALLELNFPFIYIFRMGSLLNRPYIRKKGKKDGR